MKLTTEEIHNIYLHQGGIAEGLLRAGADADFPVMFAEAIIEFYALRKTLTPTKAEIESGLSRVKWAELLIKQLPEEHEGRNSWLLNYGEKK